MPINPELLELLICPLSNESLELSGDTLKSDIAGHDYPIINGIPWVLPKPQNSLIDWSVKLNHFYQVLHSEIAELKKAIPATTGKTKERLEKLHEGKQLFLRSVFDLLTPLVRNPMASKNIYDTLSDTAPNTQNLLSYEANLYRDWVWGDEENQLSLEIVADKINKEQCEKILVLGAGAGRLALDLHQQLSPKITVASDINPLLVLASQRILQGDELSIYEFPLQPLTSEYSAIEHKIPGNKAPDNFHFVFSDATKPAMKKGAFDTVITPWFIDIQPLELSRFLQQLNHYISVGDQWINFGSLVFNQNRDAFCYSIEEVKAIAQEQGFEITTTSQQQIPYLKSPYDAGHRIETVWSWSATKTKDVAQLKETQLLPSWLRDTKQVVPKANYFKEFNLSHRLYAQLAAEVDGRTSIYKIANKLAKQQNMNKEEALNLVRGLFVDLYRQNN